jgi:Ca2+-binding EF-hand superfamily protein
LEERPKILIAVRRLSPLVCLGALLLALAAPALRAFPAAAQIKTAFAALDSSRNDAIGPDEWDAASFALFRAADKNNNNVIDADELSGSTLAQDTFLRADTNRDGRLSVSEFMELRRALFRTSDIDRNEYLNAVEFELFLLMEQVGWTDRNANGRIELSELGDALRKAFAQLDTDTNGKLTPAETASLSAESFTAFDTDKDGLLIVEEFIAGYRRALTD